MENDLNKSVEWRILNSLRSYGTRLARIPYQSMHLDQISVPDNDTLFLDSSLRRLFNRTDLDTLLGTPLLDPPTAEEAKRQLNSLCMLLEAHVDEALVPAIAPANSEDSDTSNYPRLNALINVLASTHWKFELVSGGGQKIFQTEPVPATTQTKSADSTLNLEKAKEHSSITAANQAKNQIDKFNGFLDELCQPQVRSSPSPVEAVQVGPSNGNAFRKRALLALEALSTSFETPDVCNHRVLVQLPDWDSIESDAPSSSRVLQLFLSTCPDSSDWQECWIDDLSASNTTLPPILESICEGINESHSEGEGLRLVFKNKRIFVADDESHPKQFPDHGPTKTLQELIASFSFLKYEGYNPALANDNKFSTREKRCLAALLVLSFSMYLGCEYAVEPWNASQVYFLAGPDGQCLRENFYTLCRINDKALHPNSSRQNTSSNLSTIDLTPLAKLLLEIEFGVRLDNIQVNSNGDNDSARKNLEDLIRKGLLQPDDLNQPTYLEAVRECLRLDRTCRRRMRHQAGSLAVDYTATARSVICTEIAEKIRIACEPSRKRRRHLMSSLEDDLQTMRPHKKLNIVNPPGKVSQAPRRLTEFSDIIFHDDNSSGSKPPTTTLSKAVGLPSPETSPSPYISRELVSREKFHQRANPEVVGHLFDEIDLDEDVFDSEKARKSSFFFDKLDMFHRSCFQYSQNLANLGSLKKSRVRIAILDTGLDRRHGGIAGGFADGRLQKHLCHSWVGNSVHDDNGHGTKVTDLLLRVALDTEICVAKVFAGNNFGVQEAWNVAKAIRHAVQEWDADIITMSFGLNTSASSDAEFLNAINEIRNAVASAHGRILFAAAANHGSNAPRTFPANCRDVIGIHASNGYGKDGGISPSAETGDDNFMTLGVGVVVDDHKRGRRLVSGTSYATPIAAGIAANMLHLAEGTMGLSDTGRRHLRTGEGIRKALRLISQREGDYHYIAPWVNLWHGEWHENANRIDLIRNIFRDRFP